MKPQKKTPVRAKQPAKEKKTTSWGGVASWYDKLLAEPDSYQEQVIAPNLLRIVSAKKGERLLDVGCGQGFFTRKLAAAGARVEGADISHELIALAKKHPPALPYHVAPADTLAFATSGTFDTVTSILAVQNMKDLPRVVAEMARVVKPGGRIVLVMNHPAFRVPQHSGWGYDEKARVQYRRVDRYLSACETKIVAHPGAPKSETTVSYHHSLQDIFKALRKAGLAVTRLEEWISHKTSEKGPRQAAEDTARKEFPLFLALEATKL